MLETSSPQQELGQKGNTSKAAGKGRYQSEGKALTEERIRQRQMQEQTTKKTSPNGKSKGKVFGQRQTIESPVLHKEKRKSEGQKHKTFHR